MIDSWNAYKEWVALMVKANTRYYFRGQRKPSWRLQTTFHRYSKKTGITIPQYLDEVVPEVAYNMSAMLNEPIDLSDKIQFGNLLGKLQHHGFPTPLLDWTLSPYIAAYFAFKDVNPYDPDTESVIIYMFDSQSWLSSFQQIYDLRDKTLFVSSFRPLANKNPRMIQQMAVTTVTNVTDMGEYIEKRGKETKKSFIYHATLPVSERRLVMNELNLMGINSMTMFPDFDGLCSSMKEFFFNDIDVIPPLPESRPPLKNFFDK